MNRRTQLIAVWCGPAMAVLLAVGAALLGRFVPPLVRPHFSPEHAAALYAAHASRIRLGAFITTIGFTLLGPWGCSIAAQIRRTEGDFPIVTYVLLVSVAVATTVVVITCCCWAVTVFRPGEISPQITQFSSDLTYVVFLFTWPPFTVWGIALALVILGDHAEEPVYPRWLGYLSLWMALLVAPAGLLIFFKTGAFSWAGLITLYVPVVAFFAWLISVTLCTVRNVQAGRYHGGTSPQAKAHQDVLTVRGPHPLAAGGEADG